MSEVFDLDRDTNIKNNIDAFGKKWIIRKDRTNHLLYAHPEGGREDAAIPENISGAWTKQILLQEQISMHVKKSWDKVDAIAEKKRRKAEAAKELESGKKEVQGDVDGESREAGAERLGNTDEEPKSAKAVRTEEKEAEVKQSFADMPYDQLLSLAQSQGIKSRKKVEIIEALTNGTEDD
jgi:hypothetical protein